MGSTGSVTINLPDFASMSDEEVQAHVLARMRDGRWSAQTRYLLSKFATERLELNEAWAENWTDWTCPACTRCKMELARLTDRGVLLCQLDWHHDHLSDHAEKIMKACVSPELCEETQRAMTRAIAAALPLIERFAETLICNDCNAADAAMKEQLGKGIPRFFSFSPSEIGRFVKAEANRCHTLDIASGEELWNELRADVAQRVAFAQQLGARIGAGQHNREQLSFASRYSSDDRAMFHRLGYEAETAHIKIDGIAGALLARSRSTAGRWSAAKTKPARQIQIPDRHAFALLDASRKKSPPWRETDEGWRCPCCDRNKFEITRKSNKGDWTAWIMIVNEFERETDPASLDRRALHHPGSVVLSKHYQVRICHDCRHILSDARTIRPGNVSECLKLSQVRALASDPRPHARHDVTAEAIGRIIDGNADWLAGVANYWAHRQHASDVYLEHYRTMVTTGLSTARARDLIIPQLVAAGKLPEQDSAGWFDWLIGENERMRLGSNAAN